MNDDVYRRVGKLVQSLSPAERTTLTNFLSFNSLPWKSTNRTTELLNKLDGNFFPLSPAPATNASPSFNRKNFEILEGRILDSLLLDVNLQRDISRRSSLGLRKEMLKAHVLMERGVYGRAYRLAASCKEAALQDEIYDIAIEALHFQQTVNSLREETGTVAQIIREINQYEFLRFAKRKSLSLFQELKKRKLRGGAEDMTAFVEQSLSTLRRFREKTDSRTIDFIYHYLLKEKYEVSGQYHEAYYKIAELYNRADSLPPGTPHIEIWDLIADQACLCYQIGLVDDARFFLERCICHLPEYHLACRRSVSLLFFILYSEKEFDAAINLVSGYMNPGLYRNHRLPLPYNAWKYSLACCYYSKGNFDKAIQLLESIPAGNKECNTLQVKFLRAILYIECRKYDQADTCLESLRKHISRHSLHENIREAGWLDFYYFLFDLQGAGYCVTRLKQKQRNPGSKNGDALKTFVSGCDRNLISFYGWMQSKLGSAWKQPCHREALQERIGNYYQTGKLSPLRVSMPRPFNEGFMAIPD